MWRQGAAMSGVFERPQANTRREIQQEADGEHRTGLRDAALSSPTEGAMPTVRDGRAYPCRWRLPKSPAAGDFHTAH